MRLVILRHIILQSAIAFGFAFICTSCVHQLPNEPIVITGSSEIGGWPDGIVHTSLGAKQVMRAGEQEIGLLHILILPPTNAPLVTSSSRSDEGSPINPNTLWYEWHFVKNVTIKLMVFYYPTEHAVGIGERHYQLTKGNLFVVDVKAANEVDFRQLHRTMFECREPREALKVFKSELPDNERVQRIDD
jgi:hypothetical protein